LAAVRGPLAGDAGRVAEEAAGARQVGTVDAGRAVGWFGGTALGASCGTDEASG